MCIRDRRCRELLESVREEESLQALDRLRLVHAPNAKRIYLISNLPLPGIEPDALTTMDAVTLPGRLAEVALRDGVIVTDIKELATRHPDIFATEKSAHRELRSYREEMVFNGAVSNSSYIGNRTIETENSLSYRLSGSRGGKPRTALIPYGIDETRAAEILTEIHGKSVTFTEQIKSADPPLPTAEPPAPEPTPSTVEAPAPEPPPPAPAQRASWVKCGQCRHAGQPDKFKWVQCGVGLKGNFTTKPILCDRFQLLDKEAAL